MLKAKDIMTENIISVREDTPIYEVLEIIVKHGISGMPVVKDDMALVGIVSEKDLINCSTARRVRIAELVIL